MLRVSLALEPSGPFDLTEREDSKDLDVFEDSDDPALWPLCESERDTFRAMSRIGIACGKRSGREKKAKKGQI